MLHLFLPPFQYTQWLSCAKQTHDAQINSIYRSALKVAFEAFTTADKVDIISLYDLAHLTCLPIDSETEAEPEGQQVQGAVPWLGSPRLGFRRNVSLNLTSPPLPRPLLPCHVCSYHYLHR